MWTGVVVVMYSCNVCLYFVFVNAPPFHGPLGSYFLVAGRLVGRFRVKQGSTCLMHCVYLSLFVVLIFAFMDELSHKPWKAQGSNSVS